MTETPITDQFLSYERTPIRGSSEGYLVLLFQPQFEAARRNMQELEYFCTRGLVGKLFRIVMLYVGRRYEEIILNQGTEINNLKQAILLKDNQIKALTKETENA